MHSEMGDSQSWHSLSEKASSCPLKILHVSNGGKKAINTDLTTEHLTYSGVRLVRYACPSVTHTLWE